MSIRIRSGLLRVCVSLALPLSLALASGCRRAARSFPIGGDLRALPEAGSAPLTALVPAEAEALLAVRDPAASLAALRQTGLWTRLASEGWFQDSLALPPVERWRAMQAKLSELARMPLPGPEALLHSPAVLAWSRQAQEPGGGFLVVARIDPSAARAWMLARALNAVRPSGREVEIERIKGIPVREVSFGSEARFPPGQRLLYAVLADRLLLSTDERLLSEALDLVFDGQARSLASRSPFADLESRARSAGFAAAWQRPVGDRLTPGVRSAELDGRDLTLQLDPALWSESSARPVAASGASLLLGLSGLDLRGAFARLRPELETPASAALLQRIDALVSMLGPGLFIEVMRGAAAEPGIIVAVDALRTQSPQSLAVADDPVAALAAVLLEQPQPAEPISGGVLHCSTGDEVCLATCEGLVRLTWPGGYLRETGCPAVRNGAPLGPAPVPWKRSASPVRGAARRSRAPALPGVPVMPSPVVCTAMATMLRTLLGATPVLHVSVEHDGAALTAHLSMRGAEDVELSLYELPAEPAELFAAEGSDGPPSAPPSRPPAPIANLEAGRRAFLRNAADLEAGLSSAATGLAKAWLGLQTPIARALPRPPPAEVESRGELIRAWRVDAPEAGWNYADVDLNPLTPGLYSLVMRAGGGRAAATVLVGELTAFCVRSANALALLAQERETGIPRAGAEVFVEREGHPILLGRTAADGAFTTRAQISGPIVIRQAKELAFLVLPEVIRGGDSDAVGAVLLDRTVAQPGDAVEMWSLFRSVNASDGRWSVPDSAHAELQLVDREGRTILRQPLTLSALGTATAELDLPLGLAAGDDTVAVAAGDDRRAADLTLADPGLPPLTLTCESAAHGAPAVSCLARDALGRPEPRVAVHWRLEHPLEGPTEEGATGAAITGDGGQLDVPVTPSPGGQWLRAEATDALGRSAAASLALPDTHPVQLAFRSGPRLLRPGRTATLTLEASDAGEPFRGRIHLTATAVRSGPSGESQASPLFERWLETDIHGRASLSLTANSAGYIEVSAAAEPSGASAHTTLFVSENGGDIPATPERLTLIAEAGEHRRGEEIRLLVLAPFEAGTVLVSFEPPVLPTQAVAVHGYSGILRLTLPASAGSLTAVAAALREERVITDRLSILAPRTLPLAVRAALDRPTHPGGRFSVSLDTADEAGHPLASQVTIVASEGVAPPPLADLLSRFQPSVAIAEAPAVMDSLPAPPSLEPRTTVPFGPSRVEPEELARPGFLQSVSSPESGRLSFVPAWVAGSATVALLAVAGPEEVGEARIRSPGAGTALAALASPGDLAFIRDGDEPAERRGARAWPREAPETSPLAQVIADLLGLVPATGPSADLSCAAIRALAVLAPSRPAVRGPLARLAQLENLEGGFGEPRGEMRRDLAALRGLRSLGPMAEPDLELRTRAQVGNLADGMDVDDPERVAALALVSSSAAREAAMRPTSEDLRSASASQMALWLSAHPLTRAQQQLAGARVRQLLGGADVLDLAELAVAAQKLGLRLGVPRGAPNVARRLSRLQPAVWTQALLDADEEPADPVRVPVQGPLRIGDEIEVQLTAPVPARGFFCMRDFPPAAAIPEGSSSAEESVLLCGEPSGGVLQISYRLRMSAAGRFQMPAPAFGIESPPEGPEPEWIEVEP